MMTLHACGLSVPVALPMQALTLATPFAELAICPLPPKPPPCCIEASAPPVEVCIMSCTNSE